MAERNGGRHARKSRWPRRVAIALMAVAAVIAIAAISWYLAMAVGLVPTTGVVEF